MNHFYCCADLKTTTAKQKTNKKTLMNTDLLCKLNNLIIKMFNAFNPVEFLHY
jgi:hypothetical protein